MLAEGDHEPLDVVAREELLRNFRQMPQRLGAAHGTPESTRALRGSAWQSCRSSGSSDSDWIHHDRHVHAAHNVEHVLGHQPLL